MDDNWGKLSVGVDYQYRSPVWFDASLPYGKNTSVLPTKQLANGYGPVHYPLLDQPPCRQTGEFAADELNLSLTWSDPGRQARTYPAQFNVTQRN